jgi:hypothetical protein
LDADDDREELPIGTKGKKWNGCHIVIYWYRTNKNNNNNNNNNNNTAAPKLAWSIAASIQKNSCCISIELEAYGTQKLTKPQ